MKEFSGKIAVVTGGGTGIGRSLVRQLVAEGCHVAACDLTEENLAETLAMAADEAPQGVKVTAHGCDVANEDDVVRFMNEVMDQHDTSHINLLFNNAGIAGGGSFVSNSREEWERTFDICWGGVYLTARAFLPLLLKSEEGHVINLSSISGFWASLSGNMPNTAYSAAKFAVKGFTEGLINDFRLNAPHLKASVVMPAHVGSEIMANTCKILGQTPPEEKYQQAFREGGMSPDQAATIILDGVKDEEWRILVGPQAEAVDRVVRRDPLKTYDQDFERRVMDEMATSG